MFKLDDLMEVYNTHDSATLALVNEYRQSLDFIEQIPDIVLDKIIDLPPYYKDKRTTKQLLENMLIAWCSEDLFQLWFTKQSQMVFPISLLIKNGTDRGREILQHKQIMAVPDFRFIFLKDGKLYSVFIEYQQAFVENYEIKQNKIKRNTQELLPNGLSNTIYFYLSIPRKQYFFLNAAYCLDKQVVSSVSKGDKKVYQIADNEIEKYLGGFKQLNGITQDFVELIEKSAADITEHRELVLSTELFSHQRFIESIKEKIKDVNTVEIE
ncbi:MAG: hypothetical protein QXP36_00010 [Conexivisphaerales archaeon]